MAIVRRRILPLIAALTAPPAQCNGEGFAAS
jgi:hypothetical protein